MPGEGFHQGEGMEEEGVVAQQQQAECGQVACLLSSTVSVPVTL